MYRIPGWRLNPWHGITGQDPLDSKCAVTFCSNKHQYGPDLQSVAPHGLRFAQLQQIANLWIQITLLLANVQKGARGHEQGHFQVLNSQHFPLEKLQQWGNQTYYRRATG